jgi:hypothetical protein
MTRYQVFYYHSDTSSEKVHIAVINALTPQIAQSKFQQMYHDCNITEIKEINDES